MFRVLLAALCVASCALAAPHPQRARARGGGRIIGGSVADIASYPWMVSIQNNGAHFCGGSVISSNWVLTAGHCLYGANIGTYSVRVGTSVRGSGGFVSGLSLGYLHGGYNPNTVDYDISVLQTSSALPIGSNVEAVGLPTLGYDPPGGLSVTITGWGNTVTTGTASTDLMKVDITVLDRNTCIGKFGITDRMICAGEAGKSTCYGDSGGPLVSGTTQVGIVSWGRQYCEDDGGVYSNVGNLRSFITETTGV